VRNTTGGDALLVIEPWGMPYEFPRDATFELVVEGPATDALVELDRDEEGLVVWAWGGSTAELKCEGRTLGRHETPTPALPPGVTTAQVLGAFGLAAARERNVAGFDIQQTWEDG
jgi:hypothetical protein